MVDKKGGPSDVTITFRLPPMDGVESVHVVGEFNDWSTSACPMERDDEGWSTQISLIPGRAYRFRYLLDGERWENDWAADCYVSNEYGGDDSVIDLTDANARRSGWDASAESHLSSPQPAKAAAGRARRRTKAATDG